VDSLDILRGFMAFAVAVYHLDFLFHPFTQGRFLAYTVKKVGVFGVEGFFIISGFCFFYLYGPELVRRAPLRNFHIKRFFRIAPLYYATVLANLLLGLRPGPEPRPRMLLENATFTFGLIHPNHAMVTGGWSIGLEYAFYFAFPLLAWMAVRHKGFLLAGTLALLALSGPTTFHGVPAIAVPDQKFHAYVQVANHGFLFLAGGLIAQARIRWSFRLGSASFLALGALLFLAFAFHQRNFYDDWTIMEGWPRYYFLGTSFALVALFAFRDFRPGPLMTAGKFLGEVSYSVYLIHPLIQTGILHFAPRPYNPWGCFLAGIVLTLAFSALTYRFVERPMMGLARRFCTKEA
jgi:peptidoglycan/LPS O-acetylase OafA/YrhL